MACTIVFLAIICTLTNVLGEQDLNAVRKSFPTVNSRSLVRSVAFTDAAGKVILPSGLENTSKKKLHNLIRRVSHVKSNQRWFSFGRSRNVTIIMADNRSLLGEVDPKLEDASWLLHAAAINLQYANAHGYGFRYVQLPDECDGRHNSWCKLLLVQKYAKESSSNEFLVFLDSDAIIKDHGMSITDYLQQAPLVKDPKVDPSVYMYTNKPWSEAFTPMPSRKKTSKKSTESSNQLQQATEKVEQPFGNHSLVCAGVQIWRMPLDIELLSSWWRLNLAPHDFPWEQSGLDALYRTNATFRKHVAVIDSPFFFDSAKFIQHVCHVCAKDGRGHVIKEVVKQVLTPGEWETSMRMLRNGKTESISGAEMKGHAELLGGGAVISAEEFLNADLHLSKSVSDS